MEAMVLEMSVEPKIRPEPVDERMGLLVPLDSQFQVPVDPGTMTGYRHCVGCDVAGLVAATRVSFPLTNTFMEFSLSPDSSVYS